MTQEADIKIITTITIGLILGLFSVSALAADDTATTSVTVVTPPPNVVQKHYRWRNDDGSESAATWGAAEDTASTTIKANTSLRLRFQVVNTGGGDATNYNYRLEYALQGADNDCDTSFTSETYTAAPVIPTTEHFQMAGSPYVEDSTPTTEQLTNEGDFVDGYFIEAPDSQTGNITLIGADPDEFTEVEFTFRANTNASFGSNYCFRVTNGGTALDQYDIVASTTLQNSVVSVANLSLNNNNDITLTEDTFVWATSSMLVENDSGCEDITSVTAKTHLASTTNDGTTCTYNGNSCYPAVSCLATTTGNTCGSFDTTVEYDCGFKLWHNAQPTDSGGWDTSIWSVAATSSITGATSTATNTVETIEVNSLLALDITGSPIDYGTLGAGQDSGATNETVMTTNTGNRSLDADLGGDNMKNGSNVISYIQQKFSISPFTYSSGGTVLAASTTPIGVVLDLAKPTATTTAVEDTVYWGIGIPGGQAIASYSGTNYFTAIADGAGGAGDGFWDISTAAYLQSTTTNSTGGGEGQPTGIFLKSDGLKMYITGAEDDEVDEYDLSSAWDISTAAYVHSTSTAGVGDGETDPKSTFFKPDGLKMYVVGNIQDEVDEYNLSSAWDVSTAAYLQSTTTNSTGGGETTPRGLFFKTDGTKMYVAGSGQDEVDEYDLSSAWDISTAAYVHSTTTDVTGSGPITTGLFFRTDGLKMYATRVVPDLIDEYNLSSAWDVSTTAYVHSTSTAGIGDGEGSPMNPFFKSDGTKMYVVGFNGVEVDEYDLGN